MGQSSIVRIGVSIDEKLLDRFDSLISEKGYVNRSEAIRDMIRDQLVKEEIADPERDTVGTLTLVYSHEVRELADKLNDIQHHFYRNVVSAVHVHLDEHNCLEVLILRGRAGDIQEIADRLLSVKNVTHGKLTITSAV